MEALPYCAAMRELDRLQDIDKKKRCPVYNDSRRLEISLGQGRRYFGTCR